MVAPLKKIAGLERLSVNQGFFALLTLAIFFLPISAGIALGVGVIYATILKNPYTSLSKKLISPCLGLAICALGAGMDIGAVLKVGVQGMGYTFLTIAATLVLAFLLGRLLKVDKTVAILLGVGTAICGGSAIAATASTIKAKPEQISIAMAMVFSLNALALYIFPKVGLMLGLNQTQFGLWSALAVHDTSSVIATSMHYGPEALMVGTTVKLARALWIAPVAMLLGFLWPQEEPKKIVFSVPWFLVGFVMMALLASLVPSLHHVAGFGQRLLVVALFLVGANITLSSFKSVSWRAFIQAILLWLFASILALWLIRTDIITL